MKSMVNLHNSCNEGVDASDDLLLTTGYEPKAHDFYETTVEPYVQLLNSPALLSKKASTADPDYDDASLEDMLHQVHRAQVYHSLREDLSVSLSSSSMSDRTGQPVGDRSGQPGEHRSSEAQIWTLLDDQKERILAESQARISQHEFQAARAEEEQRLLKDNYCSKSWNFVKLIKEVSQKMKELRKFQSSAFDTMARRRFITGTTVLTYPRSAPGEQARLVKTVNIQVRWAAAQPGQDRRLPSVATHSASDLG